MDAKSFKKERRWGFEGSAPLVRLILLCKFSVLLSTFLGAQPLLVAAASDLAPLEPTLRSAIQAATHFDVRFTFGSAGMLAAQIRNGAPYDLYLSANEGFVSDLVASGHVEKDSVRVYAQGVLALWSADGSVQSLSDLARASLRHVSIANPLHAPYGIAAEQTLKSAGLWAAIQSKLVMAENVRQAFQIAESGNAEACLTAMTLVQTRGGIAVKPELYKPIRQAGGVLTASAHRAAAQAVIAFLVSPEGQSVLRKGGLLPPK